jgi:MtN3 and saliva related transmembrane protein
MSRFEKQKKIDIRNKIYYNFPQWRPRMIDRKKAEALGLVAGAITTSSFVPQVLTLWRIHPKPAPDVSLEMYIAMVAGSILWATYGFWIRSLAVKVWNIIGLGLTLLVLAYKLIYG